MTRTFLLIRKADVSGTSGTGHVADGCQFEDGTCVLRWRTAKSSTAVYTSHADLMAIHGHDGATVCEWDGGEEPSKAEVDRLVTWAVTHAKGRSQPASSDDVSAMVHVVPSCCAATRLDSTDRFVRALIRHGLGPFGEFSGRRFAAAVAGNILATEPSTVGLDEVEVLDVLVAKPGGV